MNSYTEIDGVPVAASSELLTDLLRGRARVRRRRGLRLLLAVAFLEMMHGVARDRGEAAELSRSRPASTWSCRAATPISTPLDRTGARRAHVSEDAPRPPRCCDCSPRRRSWGCSSPTRSTRILPPRSTSTRRGTARRAAPRRGIGHPARERRRAADGRAAPRGRHRSERRSHGGAAGVLLLPEPRARAPPRYARGHRDGRPCGRRSPRAAR